MILLVSVDITLYKVGSKENVRKEFVIEVLNFKDFIKGENLYYNVKSNNKSNNKLIQ